jgi:hypothetical protein
MDKIGSREDRLGADVLATLILLFRRTGFSFWDEGVALDWMHGSPNEVPYPL